MADLPQKQDELIYEGQGRGRMRSPRGYNGETVGHESPEGYLACADLVDAVNVAIFLGQPLLLMGEPGTGKTQLAHSLAWELDIPLHIFNTKMNSAGLDLFYRYDSLLHFHDAHTLHVLNHASRYIRYAALGKAILFSNHPEEVGQYMTEDMRESHIQPTRSVVLVDEIDKAPRDFPNDILAETEQLSFEVKETGWPAFRANPDLRPIVVFTSNQERNLPEAFLRRCIFYYINFPNEEDLRKIVRRRLDMRGQAGLDAKIRKFLDIRQDDQLVKKPATAELISWLRVLDRNQIGADEVTKGSDRVRRSLSVLLKSKEDFQRLTRSTYAASAAS